MYRADFARCPNDGAQLELRDDDPLIGATIGEHYVIDGFVGEGGMGRVYRAHHTRLQRRNFAIKVMLGDLAASLPTRLRFAQEADAASRLDHPNVVPVVDFGKSEGGLMFLAMELVEGRLLSDLLHAEGAFPAPRVVALARQLCLGLAHAHARGLVHRDFKPDNIIVVATAGGEVPRILDFGLALTSDDEPSARLTTVGFALGTPSYASPEQTHGEVVDLRADLFALGVTLYELLTGHLPYDGTSAEVVLLNARATPPPMRSRGGSSVPAPLEALVSRLMARLPKDRYESAADVLAALEAIDLEAPAVPRTRRWPWAVALAAVALAITSAIVLRNATPEPAHRPTAVAVAPVAPVVPVVPVVPPPPPPPIAIPEPTPAQPVAVAHAAPRPTPTPTPRRSPPPVVEASANPAPIVEPVASHATESPPDTAITQVSSPPPPPAPPPIAAPAMTRLDQPVLSALTARGSLSDSIVRRAVERVLPALADCAHRASVMSATAMVHVRASFVIDDSRRATAIGVDSGSALAGCVSSALTAVRTQSAPDVGTVAVSIDITFTGGAR